MKLSLTNPSHALLPQMVIDFSLFSQNQFPYLEVRRPFILGAGDTWKPTLAHIFMKVCEEKGVLSRIYTQNIDGLDFQLGLPDDKIISVHGSIVKISCEFCKAHHDRSEFCKEIRKKIKNIYDPSDGPQTSTNIRCQSCGKPGVKPSTVMYGRNLPDEVLEAVSRDFPQNIDLLIIIGTSLTVYPAASYVQLVSDKTPRIVCDLHPVGSNVGIQLFKDAEEEKENPASSRDIWLKGDCDHGILRLATRLDWLDSLKLLKGIMCEHSKDALEKWEIRNQT